MNNKLFISVLTEMVEDTISPRKFGDSQVRAVLCHLRAGRAEAAKMAARGMTVRQMAQVMNYLKR